METKMGPKSREQKREDALRLLIAQGTVIGRRQWLPLQRIPARDAKHKVYEVNPTPDVEYPATPQGGRLTWFTLLELSAEGLCEHRVRKIRHLDREERIDEFVVQLDALWRCP